MVVTDGTVTFTTKGIVVHSKSKAVVERTTGVIAHIHASKCNSGSAALATTESLSLRYLPILPMPLNSYMQFIIIKSAAMPLKIFPSSVSLLHRDENNGQQTVNK